jgi:hypothetical protein
MSLRPPTVIIAEKNQDPFEEFKRPFRIVTERRETQSDEELLSPPPSGF